MRLATLFLTAAVATAQAPPSPSKSLPWASAQVVPWTLGPASRSTPPPPAPRSTPRPITVHLSEDGALRVSDDKGIVRLRMGLPGRPLKLLRDWGTPLDPDLRSLPFPSRTPLFRGLGALPVGAADFRPSLEGLLWILDDDEKVLTLLHPATAQVLFLALPGGHNLSLAFHPDRLEVRSETSAQRGDTSRADTSWSVPWLALLPQFIQLSHESPHHRPEGTVLQPFPKE